MMTEKMIDLQQVTWQKEGKRIIKNVTWEVHKGEHWVLLGLNGSGKTSLLKIITGYIWPMHGTVSVFGRRFGQTNLQNVRKKIGLMSPHIEEQFLHRSNDTVLDIILSGKHASIGIYETIHDEDIERAEQLLHQLHIGTLKEREFCTLSQGEKRKVMLARALMPKPALLILDEPCTGLDLLAKEELLDSIEQMAKEEDGPTLLYVTHHIEEIVPSITHAMLIASGETAAQGRKKEVLTESTLEKTFHLPISLEWENERPWIRVKPQVPHS